MKSIINQAHNQFKNWLKSRYSGTNLEFLLEKQKYENWLNSLPLEKIIEYEKEASITTTTLFEIYKRVAK